MRPEILKAKCNGITLPALIPFAYINQLISAERIHEERLKLYADENFWKDKYYAGNRFTDPSSARDRIKSALFNINFEPSSLEEDELTHLIKLALADCASCDYYYQLEKEWD